MSTSSAPANAFSTYAIAELRDTHVDWLGDLFVLMVNIVTPTF